MKERPILFSGEMVRAILDGRKTQTRRVITDQSVISLRPDGSLGKVQPRCKHGQPGDRLWVRETWAMEGTDETSTLPLQYKADRSDWLKCSKWRPSIHMPRWASRITLEIESVRLERVQEITEEDAIAEGSFLGRCKCLAMQEKPRSPIEALFKQTSCHKHGKEFRALWDSINQPRGFGWYVNPWVWVITFKRVE